MSDALEQEYDDFRPRHSRARILLFTAVGVIVAIFLVSLFAQLYTDQLWYRSVGFSSVFSKLIWTRVGLFVGFGLVLGAVVAANMVIAYRARPFHRPDSPEQTGLDRYRDAVAPIRTLLLVSVSLVIGLFGGVAANGQWRQFLLWSNREPFHATDPYFHKDVGFYVFTLPWLHFVVGYVIAILILSALCALVVHYLYGGIRLQAPADKMSRAATIQLSVLIGLALIAKAVGYWLDRFDLVTSGGSLTGMNYTDQHAVLPARNILVWVALICAVLFFLTIWRRTWLLAGVGVALLLVTSILLGLIWPTFVQHLQVNPSELDKEAPYIQNNIDATRAAYDLNDIDQVQAPTKITAGTVANLMDQTQSVPLLDPSRMSTAFNQIQGGASYYSVNDVLDVDHYEIDGTNRSLLLGVRELDKAGITPSQQNWTNLHTVYTHGNGVIAAYGNQRPADNSAQSQHFEWAEGQGPGQDSLEKATGPFQSQVYFGEGNMPSYSIVGKTSGGNDVELDLSANGSRTSTTYDGQGGVPVGSFFNKLMYAIKFGDSNFLLSGRVGPDSSVIYDRDPADRVAKVAPWLTLDSDSYPVVVDGHLLWVVDGYTTTDQYPQSQRDSFETMTTDSLSPTSGVRTLPTDEVNYVRNAVKATVDAYTGKVMLYAWDESDPILQAWRSAFPGSVLDRSQIPADLKPHLRYAEDQFKVQRYQYQRYHVTNPDAFFSVTNVWEVPEDAVRSGYSQTPIRMFSTDPQSGKSVWSLLSTYVPRGKSNLVGVLSVDSDPTSPDYGKMLVEEPRSENVPGPTQAYNNLISNPRISKETQRFKLGDATAVYGSVVTVPLANRPMYVVPVYAQRSQTDSSSYLTLRYVMVQYGSKVGIGDTLVDAISDMVGAAKPPANQGPGDTSNQQPTKGDRAKARALLQQAQADFAEADRAFKQGDAARWVKLNHQARVEVAKALRLLG